MSSKLIDIFNQYVELREKISFDPETGNSRERYICFFESRIYATSQDIVALIKTSKHRSYLILARSVYELFVNLRLTLDDKDFIVALERDSIDAQIKRYKSYSNDNPYSINLSKNQVESTLKELNRDKKQTNHYTIKDKSQKVKSSEVYTTIYAFLCEYAHGNVSTLNLDNASTKDFSIDFWLATSIRIVIESTREVCKFFRKYDEDELLRKLICSV